MSIVKEKLKVNEYKKDIYVINHEYAEMWVGKNTETNVDYYYGGTRTVNYNYNDEEVYEAISYLESYESGLKNALINEAMHLKVFDKLSDELPTGFLGSSVGGGRCVIKPKNKELAEIISDVNHEKHNEVIDSLFESLGDFLNSMKGEIKLTPDFGRFAGLADSLNKYTDNVLGIACEKGGCGGKASYTSTGIVQAILDFGGDNVKDMPITLIGAAGACGIGVLNYLLENNFKDVAVCDLSYDIPNKTGETEKIPAGVKHITSKKDCFTNECLSRGGIIIATTVGGELINSDISVIKENTILLLALNEAIPSGEKGINFIDGILKQKNITIVPGQFLTFGGALTSRLEWFWRNSRKNEYFNKPLAHKVVKLCVEYWVAKLKTELDNHKNLFKYLYKFLLNN